MAHSRLPFSLPADWSLKARLDSWLPPPPPAPLTVEFVNEKPLTFMRHRITVQSITGAVALLSSGPPVGTKVATVGVAELYGTETDVGED